MNSAALMASLPVNSQDLAESASDQLYDQTIKQSTSFDDLQCGTNPDCPAYNLINNRPHRVLSDARRGPRTVVRHTSETTMQPLSDFQPTDDGGAIYQQLADEIRRRVAAGELKVGERLPPQRELARMLG